MRWTLATTLDGVGAVVIEGIAEHRGEWVAVDYAKRSLVLSAATRSALLSELKRLGLHGGVVLHVPELDEPLLSGVR